ncbi:MAG: hypothetical protein VKI82_02965 [Leptolyngbya sp.]|nr:hypothetical protein [Leptolyngbya sp.]
MTEVATMSDEPTLTTQITITFNNGAVQTYGLTERQTDPVQMASRLKNLMEASTFSLEVENRLVIIPMHNIRTIEVSPAPDKLPDLVLRQAVSLD